METYGGVDVYIHSFLTSALVEVGGQLHARAALPPGKESLLPIGQEVGGPQSPSGRRGEEKILDPAGAQARRVP
jgi:hypothetical protein